MKAVKDMNVSELAELILSRSIGDGECFTYTGYLTKYGYGELSSMGNYIGRVHRLVWEAANGAILDGMTVDHTCFNRACVNLDHLRLLTNAENAGLTRRSIATECPNGHEYSAENTRIDKRGRRLCRVCNRDWARRNYARIEAAR